MKPPALHHLFLGLLLSVSLPAEEVPAPANVTEAAEAAKPEAAKPEVDPQVEAQRKEQEALSAENKLQAERLTKETNAMRAEITRLKMERELLTERLALEAAKRQATLGEELAKLDAEKERYVQENEVVKARAEKLTNDLKVVQTEASISISRLQNEISRIETEDRRDAYADFKPVYLEQPLREDGTLVVSDRRIALNGMIVGATADYITERIQYWNNKDRKLPIFIVIDASPGGSVMAGYRILKAMESSDAPIHVVVKSFAASMAAAITTLAEHSYAYPNAVLLHHQISLLTFGQLNLTQQREMHEESQRWWDRLGTPIAKKMGISTEDFIKRMYESSSSGDWTEFATEAQQLKWVNNIVEGIDETSVTQNPDAQKPATSSTTPKPAALTEEIDANGKPFAWLPRLEPKDVYFLYNPDGYYRMR